MYKHLPCIVLLVYSTLVFSLSSNNLRLNKVFKVTHSRRKADSIIADGRVRVNGEIVEDMGRRVVPFQDIVELDGKPYTGWEARHGFVPARGEKLEGGSCEARRLEEQEEEIIKYWKPVGVTSTTDRNIPGNLLDALEDSQDQQDGITQRIFSVGRLDKDSSGLLLLTSDGRLPNAVLRKEFKRPKTYRITVNKPVKEQDAQLLRRGLVITTDTVRQGRHQRFTARTLPCKVKVLGESRRHLEMELTEGRNRQIRVMLKSLGYTVVDLHRTHFLGIDLSRLRGPGDWTRLNDHERAIVNNAMTLALEKE